MMIAIDTVERLRIEMERKGESMSKIPDYYVGISGKPAWDVIVDFKLNYFRGCVLKYLVRAGRKTNDPTSDLKKAIHCLEKELEIYEKESKKEGK